VQRVNTKTSPIDRNVLPARSRAAPVSVIQAHVAESGWALAEHQIGSAVDRGQVGQRARGHDLGRYALGGGGGVAVQITRGMIVTGIQWECVHRLRSGIPQGEWRGVCRASAGDGSED
jgi:hypothetical protein